MHLHLNFGFNLQLVKQIHDLVFEDILQKENLFEQGILLVVERIIIVVEGDPVADMVAAGGFAGGEFELFHVQFRDAHRRGFAVELERPVGLGEEMVEFFDAFVEANEHGFPVLLFVLNQRMPVVKTAVGIVVVVK